MNNRMTSVALFALTTAVSQPCASVYREGERVLVESERVLIVWNPQAKTQHFIRQITFDGKAKDFGFLVPTPSVPKLAEVDGKLFARLDGLLPQPRSADRGGAGGVTVITREQVGKFEATVLKADDARSLESWLTSNGYASRPALSPWYTHYIARGWVITAFKFAKNAKIEGAETSFIRMSFATDYPIYPYREPQERRDRARSLLVHFLSTGVGTGWYEKGPSMWQARVLGKAAKLPEAERESVAADLKIQPTELPKSLWMTTFLDQQINRIDSDLRFTVALGGSSKPVP